MGKYEPGTYEKDGKASTASSASEAVALVFQGYKRVEDEAPKAEDADETKVEETEDEVAPKADEPVSALEGAEPNFDEGSPSEENTSPELAANQSKSAYTF